MLLYIILLVLIAGKLMGGRITNLAHLQTRMNWLLLVSVVTQFATTMFRTQIPGLDSVLFILSYVGLLTFCLANRVLPGMVLVIAGVFLNFLVITVNGGAMPISMEAMQAIGRANQIVTVQNAQGDTTIHFVQSNKNSLNDNSTVLGFLGDELIMPLPYPVATAFSVGDTFLTLGLSWLILKTLFIRSASEAVPNLTRKVVSE